MIKKMLMVLVMLGLGVGLFFGLKLMQEDQDLRREAVDEKVTLNFTTVGNLDIGSTFKLVVIGSGITEPGFGLVKLRFVFDKDKLSLEKNSNDEYDVRLNSKFGTGLKQFDADNEVGFVDILGAINKTESQITGVVNPFMTFVFKVKSAGTANVHFAQSEVGGEQYTITGLDSSGNNVSYGWVNGNYDLTLTEPVVSVNGGWSSCLLAGAVCKRSCTNPPPSNGGTNCSGSTTCALTDCTSEFGVWGAWGSCSKSCGSGIQTRTCLNNKYCLKTGGGSLVLSENRPCNTQACAPTCQPTLGDVNNDGISDLNDLTSWYEAYRNDNYQLQFDFNCDEKINVLDVVEWYKGYRN